MRWPRVLLAVLLPLALALGCSATEGSKVKGTGGSGGGGGPGGDAGINVCDSCFAKTYTPCNADGTPGTPVDCPDDCAVGVGCVKCVPGSHICVGNEVHECTADGSGPGKLLKTCDTANGKLCGNGVCGTACEVAAGSPSNIGCEFWAVDLDQQDALNDPASAPWGVVLSNAGVNDANVTIQMNTAAQGKPVQLQMVKQVSIKAGDLSTLVLPTRELDCGVKPNDYSSPGTCLSSRAYRITSSAPIVVYQFNTFQNAFSNDASLLLPTNALGKIYRVIGWPAGHPTPIAGFKSDRAYVTIVGTQPNTQVTVKATFRLKNNPPVQQQSNGEVVATIGPFDVLNLETDDATLKEAQNWGTDLSGTVVQASAPVAVFSGVESTEVPGQLQVPEPPGGADTCCLDHLEEQMFPVESIGTHYVVTRSPVRSTGSWREPDVIRFVGVAETANVTTNLPSPYDHFTIQPGEIKTTWTQDNFVATADKPVIIGQLLVSQGYVDGPYVGDPSLTVFPPVEQFRTEYVILTPPSWTQNWVVIATEQGNTIKLDGNDTTGCKTESAGTVLGASYESRVCSLAVGVHRLSGSKPFGIVAYGYGSAGSYAFAGGADVKPIYTPPPIK